MPIWTQVGIKTATIDTKVPFKRFLLFTFLYNFYKMPCDFIKILFNTIFNKRKYSKK